jgi:uncharacterized protein (DUF1697 family)
MDRRCRGRRGSTPDARGDREAVVADRRVALLRGINVGRAKRISMADLRAVFTGLGYLDVRTLLNSGNVVFTVAKACSDHGHRIECAVADRLGVEIRVTILSAREVDAAIRENPLKAVADNPSRLLVMAFRHPAARRRLTPLLKDRWTPEALALGTNVAYLWCADGINDSRLWAAVNRIVGDAGTARNLATMTKLLALVGEGSESTG